jgi:hypothetical protein
VNVRWLGLGRAVHSKAKLEEVVKVRNSGILNCTEAVNPKTKLEEA